MIMDKLYSLAKEKSPICVGLDTLYDYLPDCLANSQMTLADKIYTFNKQIIDATLSLVACYKVQIAYYEALGLQGLSAYARTLDYIKQVGAVSIADVKRGDISATAQQYAKAHFCGDFSADIVTLNAYMGQDAISPYYQYLDEKGIFVLVKTSNPSSGDFQDRLVDGKPLYLTMAEKVAQWGKPYCGKFSSIGAVVGCTYPQEFFAIRESMPNTFFLIPGYGAQGGKGSDIAQFFADGVCGVVNSSRGIITAHKKNNQANWVEAVYNATLDMKRDLQNG